MVPNVRPAAHSLRLLLASSSALLSAFAILEFQLSVKQLTVSSAL